MKPTMVQYTGDFKTLRPSGWRFQKLYAKNYRAYMKDDMLIWQAGREFRIDVYGDFTSVLIAHIMEHGAESLQYRDALLDEIFGSHDRYWIILDKTNLKLIRYDSPEHREYLKLKDSVVDRDMAADFYAQYREANVSAETMSVIVNFIRDGQLKLDTTTTV